MNKNDYREIQDGAGLRVAILLCRALLAGCSASTSTNGTGSAGTTGSTGGSPSQGAASGLGYTSWGQTIFMGDQIMESWPYALDSATGPGGNATNIAVLPYISGTVADYDSYFSSYCASGSSDAPECPADHGGIPLTDPGSSPIPKTRIVILIGTTDAADNCNGPSPAGTYVDPQIESEYVNLVTTLGGTSSSPGLAPHLQVVIATIPNIYTTAGQQVCAAGVEWVNQAIRNVATTSLCNTCSPITLLDLNSILSSSADFNLADTIAGRDILLPGGGEAAILPSTTGYGLMTTAYAAINQ
jgi:hypothetical protein